MDCTRITDCRRIRHSTGLPDYGLFSDLGRFVSGQSCKRVFQIGLPIGVLGCLHRDKMVDPPRDAMLWSP
eukprot:15460436-Alexandrium_andersonii.AAC.1